MINRSRAPLLAMLGCGGFQLAEVRFIRRPYRQEHQRIRLCCHRRLQHYRRTRLCCPIRRRYRRLTRRQFLASQNRRLLVVAGVGVQNMAGVIFLAVVVLGRKSNGAR